MSWLNKLERKFRKFAIPGLINYIVGITAVFYLVNMLNNGNSTLLVNMLLIPSLVLKGEVWRLFTFVFIPPDQNPILIFFALYIEYMIGTALEREWGSFKFNFYYLTGVVLTIIGAFLSGGITSAGYLSTSLFLAFAYVYPDFELLIFFILPVKVKYLGMLTWVLYVVSLITGSFNTRLTIIASVLNFFIYFSGDIIRGMKNKKTVAYKKHTIKVRTQIDTTTHKCTICGRTEKDDPNLEFRYCSKCNGRHAYCSEHLFSHKHIT